MKGLHRILIWVMASRWVSSSFIRVFHWLSAFRDSRDLQAGLVSSFLAVEHSLG